MLRKQDEEIINSIPHQLLEKYDIKILTSDEIEIITNKIINDSRKNIHEQYAFEQLLKNITLVAYCDKNYYGYWHGKDGSIPLEKSPIVLCDTSSISLTYSNLLYSIIHYMTIHRKKQDIQDIQNEFSVYGMYTDSIADDFIHDEENDPLDIFLDIVDDSEYGRVLKEKQIVINKDIKKEFKKWCNPKFGHHNPTKIESALLWEIGVQTRENAYTLAKRVKRKFWFGLRSECVSPKWSFDRFGKSVTRMPDGREIHIAGEHEDWYDEDFYIYNDVIEIHPDDTIVFYTYPKSIFPPTDSHSATLVGDKIIIIGGIGYESIVGYTPVYQLDTNSFKIEKLETTGDMPGWIFKHRATIRDDTIEITEGKIDYGKDIVKSKNTDKWLLNLKTKIWIFIG